MLHNRLTRDAAVRSAIARIGHLALVALLTLSMGTVAGAQSLPEMAGQMILVGFQGDGVDDAGVVALREDIAAGRVGGVMFLRTNVASLPAVREMNAAFLAASSGLPLLIAIDQEGGLVERLTEAVGFRETPSAEDVAGSMSPEGARAAYLQMASGLADAGFNLNFGPVVDIDRNPDNPVIGRFGRAFGDDAETVVTYASEFVGAHRDAGVLTALKHFPGHGSSADDSHEGFTEISATWDEVELEPFRALIADGLVDLIMSGHLYHDQFDGPAGGQQLPASLSSIWIGQILRRGLNFDGVVVSDDMEMGAIREHYSLEDAVIRAVWAGTDILLFSNTANARTTLAAEVQAILVAAAEQDDGFRRRIEQSYQRIATLKARL